MKTHTVAAAVLVVIAAACSGQGSPTVEEPGAVSVGETAPAFSLPSADGGTVSSSDYAGKPVLLYFSMGPG